MKIGQIVYDLADLKNFQTEQQIAFGPENYNIEIQGSLISLQDSAIVAEKPFEKNTTYAIDFNYTVAAANPSTSAAPVDRTRAWSATVMLIDNDNKYQMVLATLPATKFNESNRLKLIFTPNRQYTKIIVQLNRKTGADYGLSSEYGMPYFAISAGKCYSLANLIQNKRIKRMGIQAFEGLSFTINGEDFQIGKSGYYSLENANISSLGCYVPSEFQQQEEQQRYNDRKFFIIDYELY